MLSSADLAQLDRFGVAAGDLRDLRRAEEGVETLHARRGVALRHREESGGFVVRVDLVAPSPACIA